MYSANDRRSLLSKARQAVIDLQWAVRSLPSDKLSWRPAEHQWSAHEVLSHVRDVQREVYGLRVRRILSEEKPSLELFDETRWQAEHYHPQESAEAMLAELRRDLEETLGIFEKLPAEAWERVGIHPELGPTTAEYWAFRMCAHTVEHLDQILDIHQQLWLQSLRQPL